jgi:hypothetical protein
MSLSSASVSVMDFLGGKRNPFYGFGGLFGHPLMIETNQLKD